MCTGQLVTQIPVLDGAQFGQRLVHTDEGVFVHPTYTGRIRADSRRNAAGQLAGGSVEVFQHPRARPIKIGAILENDIYEGGAEHREAPHHLRFRHRDHRRSERISDLIFHHLRRLSGILGKDDHLHVRQVWQRIQRGFDHCVNARQNDKQGGEQHQSAIARRPVYDGV